MLQISSLHVKIHYEGSMSLDIYVIVFVLLRLEVTLQKL